MPAPAHAVARLARTRADRKATTNSPSPSERRNPTGPANQPRSACSWSASQRNASSTGAPPTAATIIAPGWAHWSIGDYTGDKTTDAGTTVEVREWNDDTFGVFPLPGTTEVALPHSAITDTEALALPEPEMEAAAPAYGCRDKIDDTVYLTN